MTKPAFENAIMVASAIAASTNAPIHINAIARHVGVDISNHDWQRVGSDIPVLADVQPAGQYLGEDFFHAGGIPAIMHELLAAGLLHGEVLTVSGRTVAENVQKSMPTDQAIACTTDRWSHTVDFCHEWKSVRFGSHEEIGNRRGLL
jgi:dihydroxy-acid dehydratase